MSFLKRKRSGSVPVITVMLAGFLGPTALGCSPDPSAPATDPGRVTMHRLHRVEYNNTVRDLLGTTQTPADDFPADDRGYGFDNIADVLSTSPLQAELYSRAAENLAHEAMLIPTASQLSHVEAETLMGQVGSASAGDWNLSTEGELPVTHDFLLAGKYRIAARVWGNQAGTENTKMNLRVGGVVAGTFDVSATSASPIIVEVTNEITAGTQGVAVEFLNDFVDQATGADRDLHVDWIEIEGPLGPSGENPIRERIVTCDLGTGEACIRQVIEKFAERAFRRPVTELEIERFVALVNNAKTRGKTTDVAVEIALGAILSSPHFIFRPEIDPLPNAESPKHPLNDFELASRLSYFLWSSMPDEALFEAARAGKLQDPAEIERQVDRMLLESKSDAIIDNFAGQWLYIRALDDAQPDYYAFPTWDGPLREAMRKETKLFFRDFMENGSPMREMLTADFTFLNDRLAEHYGLPLPGGTHFRRVTLDDPNRMGLLGQGSVLTVTSYPTRTSPTKRGKWLMTQLLCTEPPAPPPGVEGLAAEMTPTGSIRQRLEKHRENPICAACHLEMDALGFGLEHYDGIGSFRMDDNGFPVDATGTLPGGKTFDGMRELSTAPRKSVTRIDYAAIGIA